MTGRREGGSTPPVTAPQHTRHKTDEQHSSNEDFTNNDTAGSSAVSSGSGEPVEDGVDDGDGGRAEGRSEGRLREASDTLAGKIHRTKEAIRLEQKAKNDNVDEYLKCAGSADKHQITRIKAVFEKKNQRSASAVLTLQKKLEVYTRRLQNLQTYGVAQPSHRQPKAVLRDMGHGLKNVGGTLKDGLSGLSSGSGLISKPREFAHLFKNRFGSVDNIKEAGVAAVDDCSEGELRVVGRQGSATLPPGVGLSSTTTTPTTAPPATTANSFCGVASTHSGVANSVGGSTGAVVVVSEDGSECDSSITSGSLPMHPPHHQNQGDTIAEALAVATADARQETDRLREELELLRKALQAETERFNEKLGDERARAEQLEQQVNDLTELHQNEMESLKAAMSDMEEKVHYQSEERVRDVHEMLENCGTRIARMEHQQAQQQQQFLTLEGLEYSNARALFVKFINILLTVLQVLLLVVATLANLVAPLLHPRSRLLASTACVMLALALYYWAWPALASD